MREPGTRVAGRYLAEDCGDSAGTAMHESLTIYAPQVNHWAPLEALRGCGVTSLQLIGTADSWTRLVAAGQAGELTLNTLVRLDRADQFSTLVFQTADHVENIEVEDVERRDCLVARIANSEMLVGIVAEQGLEGNYQYIQSVAAGVDGVIFDGTAFLDCHGRVILGSDGSFDPLATI